MAIMHLRLILLYCTQTQHQRHMQLLSHGNKANSETQAIHPPNSSSSSWLAPLDNLHSNCLHIWNDLRSFILHQAFYFCSLMSTISQLQIAIMTISLADSISKFVFQTQSINTDIWCYHPSWPVAALHCSSVDNSSNKACLWQKTLQSICY